jgi:hypothetical protein
VLDRMAWLNGSAMMPSVERIEVLNSDRQLRKAIDIAKARLAAARPLPPNLEDLARNANAKPQWAVVQRRLSLFAGAIVALWVVFFVGFKMTSAQYSSAGQRSSE